VLIAQITDIHLGFDPGNREELNRQRLDRVLEALTSQRPLPDLMLATGDLAENGNDGTSYQVLRDAISGLPFPVYPAIGNHDSRDAFLKIFPETPSHDGFVQYAIDDYPVRILVLDTMEYGRHGGGYDEVRADWLRARLAEAPARPTLLVLHHPPIETGLSWMTENPKAAWVKRLQAIVAAHGNIVGMVTGHLHRPVVTRWAGTILAVCPSTAPLVALDLAEIDAEMPDERPMVVTDRPYYALHYWNGRELVTHFDSAEDHEALARFGPRRSALIRMLERERDEA
jgi:3',5'-cyclic AMP phosphodiesterase CpdA